MEFIVSTDAASDLDIGYIRKNNVKLLSMKYFIDDKNEEKECIFGNGEPGLSYEEFYENLRNGKHVKTALINEDEHREYFKKLLAEGKNIIHIPLSSGLSGTAEFAARAAERLNALSSGAKIAVVDFKGASMGQGLFVDYLVKFRNDGKTFEEVVEWAEKNKYRFCHYFTVDDLGHLKRGGRVSGVAAFIGSIIKIKPLLHVNNDGKLIPLGKSIGRKKALANLVEKMKMLIEDNNQRIFISHGDSLKDAEFVAEAVTKEFGITDITIGFIGPIVGAHSGPGTIALFFVGKNR